LAASTRPVAAPENMRWFWSLTINGPVTRADRVATLEEAKAQLQKSWDACKAWAELEEVACPGHRHGLRKSLGRDC